MSARRRFVAGIAGVSLGSGLLAVSYLLDRTLLGPFTTVALVSASTAALAAAAALYAAYTDPEFDFERSNMATIAFAGGIAAILGGVVTLAFAVAG